MGSGLTQSAPRSRWARRQALQAPPPRPPRRLRPTSQPQLRLPCRPPRHRPPRRPLPGQPSSRPLNRAVPRPPPRPPSRPRCPRRGQPRHRPRRPRRNRLKLRPRIARLSRTPHLRRQRVPPPACQPKPRARAQPAHQRPSIRPLRQRCGWGAPIQQPRTSTPQRWWTTGPVAALPRTPSHHATTPAAQGRPVW